MSYMNTKLWASVKHEDQKECFNCMNIGASWRNSKNLEIKIEGTSRWSSQFIFEKFGGANWPNRNNPLLMDNLFVLPKNNTIIDWVNFN